MKNVESAEMPEAPAPQSLRIASNAARLSPAQQTFNRLTAQLEQTRLALQQWVDLDQHLQTRALSELAPLQDQVREAQIQLLEQIDRTLGSATPKPVLKRTHVQILGDFLLFLSEHLLDQEQTPDPRIEALFDRHSPICWRQEQAKAQAIKLRIAEDLIAHNFGEDLLKDHGAEDLESFLRSMDERMAAQREAQADVDAQAQAPHQAQGPRPNKRQAAAAARRAQEDAAATQSIREIYRKLASSLHPDRETNLAERERKTVLMQQINVAFQKSDLLALLNLQMQVAQLDSAALASLPEDRLKHYNKVLSEQQQALKAQVHDHIDALLRKLGCTEQRSWQLRKPADFEREFNGQLREYRQRVSAITDCRHALQDPRLRNAQIAAFAAELKAVHQRDEDSALQHMLDGFDVYGGFGATRSSAKRGRRSGR
jgi:hypothetical protein